MTKLRYLVYRQAWFWWHCTLRRFFDRVSAESYWGAMKSRPWWHLCCNGDAGGWRTAFCDHLEVYWRTSPHEYE